MKDKIEGSDNLPEKGDKLLDSKGSFSELYEALDVLYESEAIPDLSKDEKYKNMHLGHRKRVCKSVDRDPAFSSFSQHEILEYFLFSLIPRADTNLIAHDLINTFGGLSSVLNSTVQELVKVPYISESIARAITAIVPIARQSEVARIKNTVKISNTCDIIDYMQAFFTNLDTETLYLLSLSAQDKVIKCEMIMDGGTNYTAFNIRKILSYACNNAATKVVLAHNHPSGECKPSIDDVEATSKVLVSLATAGIHLLDHIIYTPTNFYSFFLNGIMEKAYVLCDTMIGTSFVEKLYEKSTVLPSSTYIFEDSED